MLTTFLGSGRWAAVFLMVFVVALIFERLKYLRFRRLPRTIAELVLCPHKICPPAVDNLTLEQWRAHAHDYGTYPSTYAWLEEHGLPRKTFKHVEPITAPEHARCYECHELLSLETDEIIEIHTARRRTYCHGCWWNFIRPRWRRYLIKKFMRVRYLRLMNKLHRILFGFEISDRHKHRMYLWVEDYADNHIMRRGRTHWSHEVRRKATREGSALLLGV